MTSEITKNIVPIWLNLGSNNEMAPRGFEPPTPGLKVQCSNQAELRSH